ncbi:HTH domain-containing protein [Aeromonas rivipollensis]|uniref:HTH domain-containing protein n=2 Tax=Aeromonas TaxID=642 RepID=A0AAW9YA04_9GAMM|nr:MULTISPECIES: HTH domain-containing protein [Aeromonas]MCK2085971.1 HTH domain-containing protein [Aeromonas genomosp. paramedia]MCV3289639.1 HTH domain-containing protein [Aeromonas media]NEX75075.1 HTH domain-containing protein [Aeromonas rivipollensis]
MADKHHQAIIDALDVLARGASTKTNGKITSVNLAREAGVSRATIYRYLDEFQDLNDAFEALKKNGIQRTDNAPITLLEAYQQRELEVKKLRSELKECKQDIVNINKLRAHQIQLLWMENNRLQDELSRLKSLVADNISNLLTK